MELMNTNTAVATKSRTLDLNTSSSAVLAAGSRLLKRFTATTAGRCNVAAMLMCYSRTIFLLRLRLSLYRTQPHEFGVWTTLSERPQTSLLPGERYEEATEERDCLSLTQVNRLLASVIAGTYKVNSSAMGQGSQLPGIDWQLPGTWTLQAKRAITPCVLRLCVPRSIVP